MTAPASGWYSAQGPVHVDTVGRDPSEQILTRGQRHDASPVENRTRARTRAGSGIGVDGRVVARIRRRLESRVGSVEGGVQSFMRVRSTVLVRVRTGVGVVDARIVASAEHLVAAVARGGHADAGVSSIGHRRIAVRRLGRDHRGIPRIRGRTRRIRRIRRFSVFTGLPARYRHSRATRREDHRRDPDDRLSIHARQSIASSAAEKRRPCAWPMP
jgi:hypothetical protein